MFPAYTASKKSRRDGFTLIELLVVLFIIGILIALVVGGIGKTKRAVYGAQTQAQLSALSNAIQQYYNDYKSYPGPLPNNQLCTAYDPNPTGNEPSAPPFVGAIVPSILAAEPLANFAIAPPAAYNPALATGGLNITCITSSQNLVLGLLGGLEMQSTTAGGGNFAFYYNLEDIFAPDGITPTPKGPASLNVGNPRRQQAYIQVRAGEISTPTVSFNGGNGASFADSANRSPGDQINTGNAATTDAMIPVFLDKYPDPLPILYYRTNAGAQAIVGFRNCTTVSETTQLQDPTTNPPTPVVAQYDLLQNLPYVCSAIGTQNGKLSGTLHNPNSFHGLQGITNASNSNQLLITVQNGSPAPTPPIDPIDYNVSGANVPTNVNSSGNGGNNALAYFKDPSVNSPVYDGITSNTHLGTARQKDGYILISAGADRLYGTHDDQVFPGPLQP